MFYNKFIISFLLSSACLLSASAQRTEKFVVRIDTNITYQTIRNFGASDAWACQFIGNWPRVKKEQIADWLFSMDTLPNGDPKGIGLTMWRYNLGAGSAEQGQSSRIRDDWRRAPLTVNNNQRVAAQNWFLRAAEERGVHEFLGFFNSPPVQFTRNGKAFADSGRTNIERNNYQAFADYTVAAIKGIKRSTNIDLNYLSPVNEPQWDWSDGGQEGCPYYNNEIAELVKTFSATFAANGLATHLLVSEAGKLDYLLTSGDKPGKSQHVKDFFRAGGANYIGNLPLVTHAIAAHSYFTTSPLHDAVSLRGRLRDTILSIPGFEFWQSEYCILGDNAGEIDGNRKDLGIDPALYLAKVIYEDIAVGNAAAWHWWTALSAYDYKDGLVYVDKHEEDGSFTDSKMLWALGNYSRFIRPGMQRVAVTIDDIPGLYASAFRDAVNKRLVAVFVNEGSREHNIVCDPGMDARHLATYTTDAQRHLSKNALSGGEILIPAKSVVTAVLDWKL